jgi:hypothetical protein
MGLICHTASKEIVDKEITKHSSAVLIIIIIIITGTIALGSTAKTTMEFLLSARVSEEGGLRK